MQVRTNNVSFDAGEYELQPTDTHMIVLVHNNCGNELSGRSARNGSITLDDIIGDIDRHLADDECED